MATIDNQDIIDSIIKNNGFYPGDEDKPPVTKIVRYNNQWGGKSTAIIYAYENQNRYEESVYCKNVEIVWIKNETNTNQTK